MQSEGSNEDVMPLGAGKHGEEPASLALSYFPVAAQRKMLGLLHPFWKGVCPRCKACQGEWYLWRDGYKEMPLRLVSVKTDALSS